MEKEIKLCRDYTAILLSCAKENRNPTVEEKRTILSFDGFGAFSAYLHSHDYPNSWTESEKKYHVILDDVLKNIEDYLKISKPSYTEQTIAKTFEDIRLSSLTSYYTPSSITEFVAKYSINALNEIYGENKIFNVLEPSAGTGRFLYSLNRHKGNNLLQMSAVEPNVVSAGSIFIDNTKVFNMGYEQLQKVEDKKYHLIVSNIPFGAFGVYDPILAKSNNAAEAASTKIIHNYFFAKANTMLEKGGMIAFVTTSAFCTSEGNKAVREKLCIDNNLIANILLPTNLFQNQNTNVQTSLVILQKPFENKLAPTLDENYFINGKEQTANYFDATFEKSNKFGQAYTHYQYTELGKLKEELTDVLSKSKLADFIVSPDKKILIEKEIQQVAPVAQLDMFDVIRRKMDDIHEERTQTVSTKTKDTLKPIPFIEDKKEYYQENIIFINKNYFNGKPFSLVTIDKEVMAVPFDSTLIQAKDLTDREINKAILLLVDMRDTYHIIIKTETERNVVATLARHRLNKVYDDFFFKYGSINGADKFTKHFVDRNILKGLELKNESSNTFEKSGIFFNTLVNTTNKEPRDINSKDALLYNLNTSYKVDFELLTRTTGLTEDVLIKELQGDIYLDVSSKSPKGPQWVFAANFLSGDVITKINDAKEYLAQTTGENKYHEFVQFSLNALEEIKPEFIPFDDIVVQLGNRWMPIEIYENFATELFNTKVSINYLDGADEYILKAEQNNSLIYETYQAKTYNRNYNGVDMLSFALVDRFPDATITIDLGHGKTTKVPDEDGLRMMKVVTEELKDKFVQYIQAQPTEENQKLANLYNDIYNRTVKFKADGAGFEFNDLNKEAFEPRDTQKNAVAHIFNNRGGIIDLPVGEGKTLVMIMAAHEMKRLGIINKPMIIAMKANVAQIAATYKIAYPNDKMLFPTEQQFSKDNRNLIFQQIANNDWDCIILSHDQFKFIPQSDEKQAQMLNEELSSLQADFKILNGDDGRASKAAMKGLSTRINSLNIKLQTINERIEKDANVLDFKKMGIDHLFVDESQSFKNLLYSTRHYNVAGLGSPDGSQKALNLYVATRSLQDISGSDLNITFLSGSTIKNSLVELYLLFKYMRPEKMRQIKCPSFDTWAANFAVKSTEFEFNVTGQIDKKDRFRSFTNIPELAALYSDITYYMNPKDSKLEKPTRTDIPIFLEPTEQQKAYTAKLIEFAKTGDKNILGLYHLDSYKARKAKMALACTYGRKMTLDMRVLDEHLYVDEPTNKLNVSAANIAEVYGKFDFCNGTQFVFCDNSTPKKEFNAYDELKNKLVNIHNIPKDEIAFIHDAKTEKAREKIITSFREGKIRILLGSTSKLGTGVNAQDRVVAHHHLDFPWTPEDLNQRDGRGVRFGNAVAKEFNNNNVDIYTYATKYTVEVFMAQTLKTKQDFINQIKNADCHTRTITEPTMDEGSALSFGEFLAVLSGDTTLVDRMKIEMKVGNLEKEYKIFQKSQYSNVVKMEELKTKIPKLEALILKATEDKALYEANAFGKDEFKAVFLGREFTNQKDLATVLHMNFYKLSNITNNYFKNLSLAVQDNKDNLGSYKGFSIRYSEDNYLHLVSNSGIVYSTKEAYPSDNIDFIARYFELSLNRISHNLEAYELSLSNSKRDFDLLTNAPQSTWSKLETLEKLKQQLKVIDDRILENKKKENNKDESDNDMNIVSDDVAVYGNSNNETNINNINTDLINYYNLNNPIPLPQNNLIMENNLEKKQENEMQNEIFELKISEPLNQAIGDYNFAVNVTNGENISEHRESFFTNGLLSTVPDIVYFNNNEFVLSTDDKIDLLTLKKCNLLFDISLTLNDNQIIIEVDDYGISSLLLTSQIKFLDFENANAVSIETPKVVALPKEYEDIMNIDKGYLKDALIANGFEALADSDHEVYALRENGDNVILGTSANGIDYNFTLAQIEGQKTPTVVSAVFEKSDDKNLFVFSPMGGVNLTEEKMNNYLNGNAIFVENAKFGDKDAANFWLQYGTKNKLNITEVDGKKNYNVEVVNSDKKMQFFTDKQYHIPTQIAGTVITAEDANALRNGNVVTLSFKAKNGNDYKAVIKADPNNFKTDFVYANQITNTAKPTHSFDAKERVALIKKNINLAAFLHDRFGYNVHQSGKDFYIKTDTDAGTIVVRKDTKYKTGNWLFFDNKKGTAGNLITFLADYKNYGDANNADVMKSIVAEAQNYYPSVFSSEQGDSQKDMVFVNNKKVTIPKENATPVEKDLNYMPLIATQYLNTRGIEPGILDSPKYAGSVFNKLHFNEKQAANSFLNTAFLMKNIDREIVDISMKNIGPNSAKSFSGFVEGGKKDTGLSMSSEDTVHIGKIENVVVAEAFIDAMSFSSLNKSFLGNTLDVSSEGRLGVEQIKTLQHIIDTHKPTNLILINDREKAGYAYDCTLLGTLNKKDIEQPQYFFSFKNSSNQQDSYVAIKMPLPENATEELKNLYASKLNVFATELGTIKVGHRNVEVESVTYNEITNAFNLKGNFTQISSESKNSLAFYEKIYDKCTEFFANDFKDLKVTNMKATGKDWNEDLMAKKNLSKECIMGNFNEFKGMDKASAYAAVDKKFSADSGLNVGKNGNEMEAGK